IRVQPESSGRQTFRRSEIAGVGEFVRPFAVGGALAPWQVYRAKEFMQAHLQEDIRLIQVARACNLSSGHFARAFRRSTGVSPRRWLSDCRLEKVKKLMRTTPLSLTDIAHESGFNDQSYLCRVFVKSMGISPGAWRRRVTRDAIAEEARGY